MPAGLPIETITYMTTTLDKSGAIIKETHIETSIKASVKKHIANSFSDPVGESIDIDVVIELDSAPNCQWNRIRWNNKDYKIIDYRTNIAFDKHYKLFCKESRTNH